MEAPFILPVTFWNGSPPMHRVSSVGVTENGKQIVTSSFDGQLCIWDLNVNNSEIVPRNILIAHEDPIMCLVCTNEFIISSSEGGELCRWKMEDGYCEKKFKSAFIHKNIQLFRRSQTDEELLFACGYYPEVFIIHPFTLQILYSLNSKADSDWISCFEVFGSFEFKTDVVIALTVSGYIKLWIIEEELSDAEYEKQSNFLVHDGVFIKCSRDQEKILVVASENWYIFDSKHLRRLHSVSGNKGESFIKGDFVNEDVVVASDSGKFYLYTIDSNQVRLCKTYYDESITRMSIKPAVEIFDQYLFYGDFNCRINIYNMGGNDLKINLKYSEGKKNLFGSLKVTSCIYISSFDKFICGCNDGAIVVMPAFETFSYYFFKNNEKPFHDKLHGHSGKVTCLLYPNEKYSYYPNSYLMSGGGDFSVILWDLIKLEMIHKFCVHSGEVIKLIIPPEDCKTRIKNSICSVSADHSVALLNLKERKCVILASRHLYPVVTINWKPLDDYIIVECFDGTVYVWEMETGHLDRTLEGASAQEVLFACNNESKTISNFYIEDKCLVGKDYLKNEILKYDPCVPFSEFTLRGFLVNDFENHVILFNLENLFEKIDSVPFIDLMDPVMNQKFYSLTQPLNPDIQKKLTELLDKFRDSNSPEVKEIANKDFAKFLLSILHDWNFNEELNSILTGRLNLRKPDLNADFAVMSRNGLFNLFLQKNETSPSLLSFKYVTLFALSNILEVPEIWQILKNKYELNLQVLASTWQNSSLTLRSVVRKLLTFYLQNLSPENYASLLDHWFKYLPHFKILDKESKEKFDFENRDIKKIALVIFGIIGSDLKFKMVDVKLQENYIFETCASFLYLLHLPEEQKNILDELQTIAIDLVGRNYTVWEPYLKIDKILLALLEFSSEAYKVQNSSDHITPPVDKSLMAHETLKSIALARTDKFISYLISEINQIRNQSVKNDHTIFDKSKTEIILIFNLLIEKTPYSMLNYLNETIMILLYCIDSTHLKQDNLKELLPVLRKFYQIHHCTCSQRVAVGLSDGTIVIHDLKSTKTYAISAHEDSIHAVMFSPDGRLLASYSCFENKIVFWQVSTGMFGLGQLHAKNVKTCPMHKLNEEEIKNHLEIAKLSWIDNKSVLLSLCDGSETAFHL